MKLVIEDSLNLLFLYCSYCWWSSAGVPNLGYMYLQGYICLSEGVHLRLAMEDKNIFAYYLFPNIDTYISW